MNYFRTLRADEIECRVSQISDKGLALLLYKNARVDMDILDETVGSENWQRHHSRDNANCTVSIWCCDENRAEWVGKEDTGTESNTEVEKGLASDSFKRACVNWGIGRELYTAPFVWISAKDCTITQGRNGKPQCYDRFAVVSIEYDERRRISALAIRNTKTGKIVFEWYGTKPKAAAAPAAPKAQPKDIEELRDNIRGIVLSLSQNDRDILSAYHYFTDGRWKDAYEIPAAEVTDIEMKAQAMYMKKHNGKLYGKEHGNG